MVGTAVIPNAPPRVLKPKKLTKGQLADIAKKEAWQRAFDRKQMSPEERIEELEATIVEHATQIAFLTKILKPIIDKQTNTSTAIPVPKKIPEGPVTVNDPKPRMVDNLSKAERAEREK